MNPAPRASVKASLVYLWRTHKFVFVGDSLISIVYSAMLPLPRSLAAYMLTRFVLFGRAQVSLAQVSFDRRLIAFKYVGHFFYVVWAYDITSQRYILREYLQALSCLMSSQGHISWIS